MSSVDVVPAWWNRGAYSLGDFVITASVWPQRADWTRYVVTHTPTRTRLMDQAQAPQNPAEILADLAKSIVEHGYEERYPFEIAEMERRYPEIVRRDRCVRESAREADAIASVLRDPTVVSLDEDTAHLCASSGRVSDTPTPPHPAEWLVPDKSGELVPVCRRHLPVLRELS